MCQKLNKALEAFNKGKFKQALAIVEKINNSKTKQSFTSLEIHATSLASLQSNVRAKDMFLKALELAPDDLKRGKIYFDIFSVCFSLKQHYDAEMYLIKAIAQVPVGESVRWCLTLAQLYFQTREYDKCEELCNKLLVYNLCTIKCMHMLLDISVARTNIQQIDYYLRQFEGRMQQLNGPQILDVYTKVEAYTTLDFSKSIDKAIARGADSYTVKVIQANQLFKSRKIDDSFEILNSFDVDMLSGEGPKKRYYELMGKIFDKRDNPKAAFENFQAMNQIAWGQHQQKGGISQELSKYAKFESLTLSNVLYTPPIKMVFLVGFPRSGTTLLENILDSQEKVITLPERPMLDDLKIKMIFDGYDYPACLNTITDEYLQELREHYFKSVHKNCRYSSLEQFDVLVDKNPINSIRMPFIKKLFPDAKIILALRHPLDCILSCYMQYFGINPYVAEFSNWQLCFERYKKTFDVYEGFRKYFEWDEYQIKYENLISDFENEIESLLKFMGVDADKESYMNFNKRAQLQVITTPSGSQVRQEIYQSSSQRWVKYLEFIEPHVELVRPHIERLGYRVDL